GFLSIRSGALTETLYEPARALRFGAQFGFFEEGNRALAHRARLLDVPETREDHRGLLARSRAARRVPELLGEHAERAPGLPLLHQQVGERERGHFEVGTQRAGTRQPLRRPPPVAEAEVRLRDAGQRDGRGDALLRRHPPPQAGHLQAITYAAVPA